MNTWGQGSQAFKKQIAIQRSKKLKQRNFHPRSTLLILPLVG